MAFVTRAFPRAMEKSDMKIVTSFLFCVLVCTAVEPGLPSKTSVWTAAGRAIGAKNPDPKFRNPDYLAIRFLGPRERAIIAGDYPMDALDLDYSQAIQRLPTALDRGFITAQFARTKFFDEALNDALMDGACQIVILGAGFDSRGYRFRDRLRDVAFFEVDYGPTQEYKKQRVREVLGAIPPEVRYVPMDFTKDDLLSELRKHGYAERLKTLFIWEGVTMYLPETAIKETLHFVRDHSGTGSSIAFNYLLASSPEVNNPNTRPARWGEPFIFGFPGENAISYVKGEGLTAAVDTAQLWKKYGTNGASSLPPPPPGFIPSVRFMVAKVP